MIETEIACGNRVIAIGRGSVMIVPVRVSMIVLGDA